MFNLYSTVLEFLGHPNVSKTLLCKEIVFLTATILRLGQIVCQICTINMTYWEYLTNVKILLSLQLEINTPWVLLYLYYKVTMKNSALFGCLADFERKMCVLNSWDFTEAKQLNVQKRNLNALWTQIIISGILM